jgi:hypothetical protein
MVMSIPYDNKLKVLAKISPPLPPARHDSQPTEARGALIAVEGPRRKLLEAVSAAVERALVTSGEVALKKWLDDMAETAGDVAISEEEVSRRLGFPSYLNLMVRWHEKSKQIIQHLTTRPLSHRDQDVARASKATAGEASEAATESAPGATLASMEKSGSIIPVALIPGGFSLTASDKFASAVPIGDKYAPVDHWQWMATIWRGIVGPDLVLYVKPSAEEEVNRVGTFEHTTPSLMTVRIAEGRGLDDSTERRVAFEVCEWVREWVLSGGCKRAGRSKDG